MASNRVLIYLLPSVNGFGGPLSTPMSGMNCLPGGDAIEAMYCSNARGACMGTPSCHGYTSDSTASRDIECTLLTNLTRSACTWDEKTADGKLQYKTWIMASTSPWLNCYGDAGKPMEDGDPGHCCSPTQSYCSHKPMDSRCPPDPSCSEGCVDPMTACLRDSNCRGWVQTYDHIAPPTMFWGRSSLDVEKCVYDDGYQITQLADSFSEDQLPLPALGRHVIRSQVDATLCMDLPGGDASDGAVLWMWDCYGGSTQQWYRRGGNIVSTANGVLKCVDLLGGGDMLGLWECNGSETQQWAFDMDQGQFSYGGDPSKCVRSGTAQGEQLSVVPCSSLAQVNQWSDESAAFTFV